MGKLYNSFRLLLHLSLFIIYGKYLEEIISITFLLSAFFIINLLVFVLYKMKLRSIISLPVLLIIPWLIRVFIIVINHFNPTFLQISFDMNFFLILFPLYISATFTWITLMNRKFRKYEVIINGIFLFHLFWKQGKYKITLVPNPAYLAVFTIIFLLLELLVLYLSIALERDTKKKFIDSFKEITLFFLLLTPLILYLLLPLWKIYEEGSVAGGGGLLKSSMFRFDFSEYIKLETEISMSDDLVLMFRKEGPAERLLLRRYVLSGYEKGQGFYRDEIDRINPPDKLLPRFTEYENPVYKSREKIKQELFLVNIDPTAFLSLNNPVNSQPIYNWNNSSFVRIYQSDALVSTLRIREYDPEISMNEDDFNHYTFTGEDDSIKKLAESVVDETPGALLKTMAIEDYFHNEYFYSLKPGVAPDGDQLSYFINESKKGYCSYFAFSMALMCRSLGIPARVAVGFWVDPDVSVLNFYPVRADQAHAWVEVYFNDYGWIEFDPTSNTMFPGEQYPFASFTIDEFSPLIEEILENELIPENLISNSGTSDNEKNKNRGFSTIYLYLKNWWVLYTIILYILYILGNRYIFYLFYSLSSSNRSKGKYLYRRIRNSFSFERKLYRESTSDYAVKVETKYGVPFIEITELYLKSIFSLQFTDADLQLMLIKYTDFKLVYKKNISLKKRVLYFLFPFIRRLYR